MRIVLDTNVLVSGLLTPFGTCGQVVRMLTSGDVVLCVDARILLEYAGVLRRPKFAIDARRVNDVMEYIHGASEIHATAPLTVSLPDPGESPFLEVALSAGAEGLVTGNGRHFPKRCRAGMPVLSPQEFIGIAGQRGSR